MIIPEPSAATEPFWLAAREHRLLLLFCARCNTWLHPQATVCPCGSWHLTWKEASGTAFLVSYTVVRITPLPALAQEVPYTLLLVKFLEGPQFISALPGDGHTLQCGMSLTVTFADVTPEITLIRFTPL
jgi:hypothetical protein